MKLLIKRIYGEAKKLASEYKVIDPYGELLQRWNIILLISCVLAIFIDPLFFYVPSINVKDKCVDSDRGLQFFAIILRTFFDAVYIIRIILQFRTAYIAPPTLGFRRGYFVKDIDILSIIPFPQVSILAIIPNLRNSIIRKDMVLWLIVLAQFMPRLLRIYPLFREITRTSSIFTEAAWVTSIHNLFLYMSKSWGWSIVVSIFGRFGDSMLEPRDEESFNLS